MPKTKPADRLAQACPKCGARPQKPCLDYRGRESKPCQERGRPHITAAKLQRKSDQINAKARNSYGPLFSSIADREIVPVTPASIQAKRLQELRNNIENAGKAEHDAREGLNWIAIHYMRRIAAELIGSEHELKIWDRATATFGTNLNYIVNRYRKCLCTSERVELAFVRHEEKSEPTQWNPSGIRYRLEVTESWPPAGYSPVMTREEFNDRFSLLEIFWRGDDDLPEHDDGGLFYRVMAALGRNGS